MTEKQPLPLCLRLFMRISIASTLATWLLVFVVAGSGGDSRKVWPLYMGELLGDFYCYVSRFELIHTQHFFEAHGQPFTYLAPGVPLYGFFYTFGPLGFLVYLGIAIVMMIAGGSRLSRAMVRNGFDRTKVNNFLLLTVLFSYPLLFCLHQGNPELVIAGGIACGTWAYLTGRTWTAAILWGVFGSVKLYPLILLAIFLSARQYKQFALGIFSAVLATLMSLLYIGPTLTYAAHGISGSIRRLNDIQLSIFDSQAQGFDHSLFALIKTLSYGLHPNLYLLLPRYILTFAVIGLGLYFFRIRKLPPVNQLLALTICFLLMPPISADYTLLNLYAPFGVLVLIATQSRTPEPRLTVPFILFAFLFTPTNFGYLHDYAIGGQIKCLLLIGLLVYSLKHSYTPEEQGQRRNAVGSSLERQSAPLPVR